MRLFGHVLSARSTGVDVVYRPVGMREGVWTGILISPSAYPSDRGRSERMLNRSSRRYRVPSDPGDDATTLVDPFRGAAEKTDLSRASRLLRLLLAHQHDLDPTGTVGALYVDEAVLLWTDHDELLAATKGRDRIGVVAGHGHCLHIRDLRHDDVALSKR